ncbi:MULTISPECIES: DUF5058 family protein [unclassified Clostridium]|uniref:DUF5058 family protein n=1 Tax=unclassified Clostridium TaxID=2614128 RepID=UPI001106A6A7|nr:MULTISPECIES: DUF5058 family protein [unclassified Clostridium]
MDYLQIARDPQLWFVCLPPVIMVLIQASFFIRYSVKASSAVGLTLDECKRSFRIGCVCAIGPSLGVVTVLLGMMAILGTPIPWLRLSIVGNAQQEMMMATIGADLFHTTIGADNYTPAVFATSVWMMTLHGCNFMIAVILVLHKMEGVKKKLAGKDSMLLTIIGSGALIGVITMLGVGQAKNSIGSAFTVIMSSIVMLGLNQLGKKNTKLKEYAVGISMVISMFTAQFIFGS